MPIYIQNYYYYQTIFMNFLYFYYHFLFILRFSIKSKISYLPIYLSMLKSVNLKLFMSSFMSGLIISSDSSNEETLFQLKNLLMYYIELYGIMILNVHWLNRHILGTRCASVFRHWTNTWAQLSTVMGSVIFHSCQGLFR